MTEVVYGVSSGVYSDYSVLCLCPTKKDAQTIVGKLAGDSGGWNRDARVEEFLMVDGDVEKIAFLHMSINIWDDGTDEPLQNAVREEWPFDAITDNVPVAWRWVRAPIHGGKGGRLEVSGYDHTRVRKVYSEKRAAYKVDDALRAKREAKGRAVDRSGAEDGGSVNG